MCLLFVGKAVCASRGWTDSWHSFGTAAERLDVKWKIADGCGIKNASVPCSGLSCGEFFPDLCRILYGDMETLEQAALASWANIWNHCVERGYGSHLLIYRRGPLEARNTAYAPVWPPQLAMSIRLAMSPQLAMLPELAVPPELWQRGLYKPNKPPHYLPLTAAESKRGPSPLPTSTRSITGT